MERSGAVADASLIEAIRANDVLWEVLQGLPSLRLPDCYLGAGCLAQTVWNRAHGMTVHEGLLDYDVVYFDPDVSEEAEQSTRQRVCGRFADLGVRLDVKNQARVHLWFRDRFGYDIRPYTSSCDAIQTWPTTATAVGVRVESGAVSVYAPFALGDLLGLVVRANRVQITPEIYHAKVERWERRWPRLVVLPWERGVGVSGARHTERATP